jgi:hypothetical protein
MLDRYHPRTSHFVDTTRARWINVRFVNLGIGKFSLPPCLHVKCILTISYNQIGKSLGRPTEDTRRAQTDKTHIE